MPIGFVLDENCRGPLWSAVRSHNRRGIDMIDVVRVGDLPDLPLQTSDPLILAWAEQTGRILVTYDESSMPGHWIDHLQSRRHSPGLFIVRANVSLPDIVETMVIVAHASDPGEWRDRLEYIP
jgi:Domain of unknown function (DUF5615)